MEPPLPRRTVYLRTSHSALYSPYNNLGYWQGDLYIHFAGPHAFQQIRDAFSSLCQRDKIDCTTGGGRIRALDHINNAHHFVKRAVQLGIYMDRDKKMAIAVRNGQRQADRKVMNYMTSQAYPKLVVGSEEYEKKKGEIQQAADDGKNW